MAQVSIIGENGEDERCDFAGKERRPEFDGHTSEDALRRLGLLMG
jgi:hypothetical protein